MVQAGEGSLERLYREAEGVYVRLQRQPQTHLEWLSALAYEGWERLSGAGEAYRLREKRVDCHAGDRVSFWEGVSLAWAPNWDWRYIREVILGGDGAAWIRAGVEEFAGAIWQLDGFHLAGACRQAVGTQAGRKLYQALRTGKPAEAQACLRQTPAREGKQAQRAFPWVEKVTREPCGLDWRGCQALRMEAAHGLGCREGNQAQLLAAQMKGKGRSWSPQGAFHMAKVQELLANREVQHGCYRQRSLETPRTRHIRHPHSQPCAPQLGLQAAVPALYGPSPNAPWVQYLPQLIHPHRLLN